MTNAGINRSSKFHKFMVRFRKRSRFHCDLCLCKAKEREADMDDYRNLLLNASTKIKSQEPMPEHSKSNYNIFRILEVAEKEVVMCRFLADLLNPEGQHGCGILFLKSFFNDVLRENRVSDTLLAHTDVIKEFAIDHERRIDIVICNTHFFIPIEVKIYAKEQKGQCYDYLNMHKNLTNIRVLST